MRDFSLEMYDALCAALRDAGYVALPVGGYLPRAGEGLPERVVLLRHDVESRPAHAVAMARRERDRGQVATYFFRAQGRGFDAEAIRTVAALGHEAGYHYESVAQARGDLERARALFARCIATSTIAWCPTSATPAARGIPRGSTSATARPHPAEEVVETTPELIDLVAPGGARGSASSRTRTLAGLSRGVGHEPGEGRRHQRRKGGARARLRAAGQERVPLIMEDTPALGVRLNITRTDS